MVKEKKYDASKTKNFGIRRLLREANELSKSTYDLYACPIDNEIFLWHFTFRGPRDSPYEHGIYHGHILLPPNYPFEPPTIRIMTPSGRFEVGKNICVSASNFHPEEWQPSWSIRTILTALLCYMATDDSHAIGYVETSRESRLIYAKESTDWQCKLCGRKNSELLLSQRNNESDSIKDSDFNRITQSIFRTSNNNSEESIFDSGVKSDIKQEKRTCFKEQTVLDDCKFDSCNDSKIDMEEFNESSASTRLPENLVLEHTKNEGAFSEETFFNNKIGLIKNEQIDLDGSFSVKKFGQDKVTVLDNINENVDLFYQCDEKKSDVSSINDEECPSNVEDVSEKIKKFIEGKNYSFSDSDSLIKLKSAEDVPDDALNVSGKRSLNSGIDLYNTYDNNSKSSPTNHKKATDDVVHSETATNRYQKYREGQQSFHDRRNKSPTPFPSHPITDRVFGGELTYVHHMDTNAFIGRACIAKNGVIREYHMDSALQYFAKLAKKMSKKRFEVKKCTNGFINELMEGVVWMRQNSGQIILISFIVQVCFFLSIYLILKDDNQTFIMLIRRFG